MRGEDEKAHYCRIFNARSEIDSKPPQFKAGTFLRVTNMATDNTCFKRIIAENINLMLKINQIQRITGQVKSYNKVSPTLKTNIQDVKKWLEGIDKENLYMGQKLLCMKPTMMTRSDVKTQGERMTSLEQDQLRRELFQKYKNILPIQDPRVVPMLLWPKIYIDFGVKNIRPLDRLVITLYTEAAPNVVLQFVKMCKEEKSTLHFQRVYPNLWIEGAIEVPDGTELGETQKTNPHIDHGQPGTLALLERETKESIFEFSISFKPLKVLNGNRVAFGKVVEGLKILDALQDYGTKNGKMKRPMYVSNCGLVPIK